MVGHFFMNVCSAADLLIEVYLREIDAYIDNEVRARTATYDEHKENPEVT